MVVGDKDRDGARTIAGAGVVYWADLLLYMVISVDDNDDDDDD